MALPSAVFAAPTVPANFVVENAFPGVSFTVPTKIVWMPDGRALVAEKRGKVWAVKNGVKAGSPMIAIDDDVLDNNDRGLLSIAVDPNYFVNHYIYLLYTVDPDSDGVDTNGGAFGRLSRYTVNFTDSATVIASSRAVLFGSTWTSGPVSCSPSHTIGDLNWGADSTLLVSTGDGSRFTSVDAGGNDPDCFGPGKTNTIEDIGSFRSQSLSSLCGKVLRINPKNGWGYASNPYYDGNLQSIRSRVWVYGLRNPYRFTVRLSTGSTNYTAGNPGAVFAGDVGWDSWDEQNIAVVGGRNFGWPCYEGAGAHNGYQNSNPAHNGCGSMGTSDNPVFQTSAALSYSHSSSVNSVPNYSGLWGNTATGGVFYRGTIYPAAYRQQYFFGDYGQSWLRVATVNASSNITAVSSFGTSLDSPVCYSTDPVGGDVLYVSITTGEVRRIRYTGATGNTNPVAVANGTPLAGDAPLDVQFSSAGSFDPDGDPITLSWAFGDATGSSLPNPPHTYNLPGTYAAVLTVSDNRGGIGRDTVVVTAGTATAFPSTGMLDNFNRANGAIGGSWTVDHAGLVINSNALTQTAADNVGIWNAATFGPNQEAWFTFRTINVNAPEHDLILKVQGLATSAGEVEVRLDGATHTVRVSTYTPASGWELRGGPYPATFVAGDRFGARALASGIVEVYRNNTVLGIASIDGWPFASLGGRIGVTLVGVNASRIEDFGGGDVVYAGNTPPTASITAPANGAFFFEGQNIALTSTASDEEDSPSELDYHWDVVLHHNTHVHFGLAFDTQNGSFPAENHDDGTGVFYRIHLTVTDTGGLTARDSVDIHPETDLTPTAPTFSPVAPTEVDSIKYSFRIRNLGRLPANLSRWRLTVDGNALAEGDVVVPALDSVTVHVKLEPSLAVGAHTVRLVADTLGVVVETNEANNAGTSVVTIAPEPENQPPTAVAGGAPGEGVIPLTVNFTSAGSSDPDGDSLSFHWTFGDGDSSNVASPAHVYTTADTFTAVLTVSDGHGGSANATVAIRANAVSGTFPTTAVLDDFNRANGALGGSWANTTGVLLLLQQMAPGSGNYSPVWDGATFGENQEAYVTLATLSATAPDHNLMLKIQGMAWNDGHIEVGYDHPAGLITVRTYAPGAGWETHGAPISVTLAPGDRLGARTRSDGTVEVWRNFTKLATVSIADWPFVQNGGRLGITLAGAGSSRLDNFGGGNVAEGTTDVDPGSGPGGTPSAIELSGAWPNPSTGRVQFALALPRAASVHFAVFDPSGREVWSDRDRALESGRRMLEWDGTTRNGVRASVGLYFGRVSVDGTVLMRRFVRLH